MNNITLCAMTLDLNRIYFRKFRNDPAVYREFQNVPTYIYSNNTADIYWQKQQHLRRIHLAVMLGMEPIGEVILKKLDLTNSSCTLSIHLQNDSVKNRGYGTQAEILALKHAFYNLGLKTVYADALKKNLRSRHVLVKVGFHEICCDEAFVYYRVDKCSWEQLKLI